MVEGKRKGEGVGGGVEGRGKERERDDRKGGICLMNLRGIYAAERHS